MVPIMLQSHTRAITKLIYNRAGDLLVTAAKDLTPNVWWSHNGERIGTLNGHTGAVWWLDISYDSRVILSASADNSVRVWETETGKCLEIRETKTPARCVALSGDGKLVAVITDAAMGFPALIEILELGRLDKGPVASTVFSDPKTKPTVLAWSDCDLSLVVGHADGKISLFDPSNLGDAEGNPTPILTVHEHTESIRDLQMSLDRTSFITASRDCTARLFDTLTLKPLKIYSTSRPVNSATIHPTRAEVIIAGGQEASEVTRTDSRAGQFEARFYHQIFEDELGRVKGHFGPINTLACHPSGKGYASGGEDGYVRLHTFDKDYYEFTATTLPEEYR